VCYIVNAIREKAEVYPTVDTIIAASYAIRKPKKIIQKK
jgi:hypothetical protein